MGLLSLGQPLSYEETTKYAKHVQQHGIRQFINIYKRNKDRIDRCFKWGDEIEYTIVKFDDNNRKVRLSIKAKELLAVMDKREEEEGENRKVLWRPEYGAYMVEGTPGQPYGHNDPGDGSLSHLYNRVEDNMRSRRREMTELLDADEALIMIVHFPRMGTEDFTHPYTKPDPINSINKSLYCPDECTNSAHPRYITTGINTRLRYGRKEINIPVYKDINTPKPFHELKDYPEYDDIAKVDHIFMDNVVFGMGCSCLQVTLQAVNIDEGMLIYDQMTPLTPIFLALSAATPILKGYLSDLDCRWSLLSQGQDDRTPEERGEIPLKHNEFRIHKSRYDSIDSYLCESNHKYNDILLTYNKDYCNEMMSAGVPTQLARHIAHLFIRQPTVAYRELLDQNDEIDTDHFENIQSTNWQTMRFKPPPNPPNSGIGWRVEFRPMEIQSTDFENSAYAVVIILISRVILAFGLDLMIPISKVDENMKTAQKRDAVNTGRFWFRKNITCNTSAAQPQDENHNKCNGCVDNDESYVLMSINEIINGKDTQFIGLVPLVRKYLQTIDLDMNIRTKIDQYLQLICLRASAQLMTTSQWIRQFVHKHNEYKNDSVVNDSLNYDLMIALKDIQNKELNFQELCDFYKLNHK